MQEPFSSSSLEEVTPDASRETTKDKLRAQLRAGRLDDRLVELEVQHQAMPMIEVLSGQGMEEMGIHLKDMLSNLMPTRTKHRKVRVAEARRLLGPTSAAKACSVTSSPSSRDPPSRPNTGSSAPITSCSSRPGPSTSRSRRT